MDCVCGDPSCGYCQAARGVNSDFYMFDDFVPMDPYDIHLSTILEEDEDKDDVDGDEENQQDSDQEANEEVNQIGRNTEGITLDQINELQVSEDEKKRLRNTEAARRCREKIKRKTEELEQELTNLTSRNDLMNQHRIRLLSQVEEQMRMLDILKKRNPAMGVAISYEAKKIVETYTQQVEGKRKAIREFFDRSCNKSY